MLAKFIHHVSKISMLISLSWTFQSSLLAQVTPVTPPSDEEDSATDAVESTEQSNTTTNNSENPVATSSPASAEPQYIDDAPFDRVTDVEETIFVVQRRAYLVQNKHEFTPYFMLNIGDRFVRTIAPAVNYTYHLRENLGVEAFGTYYIPFSSSMTEELFQQEQLRPEKSKLSEMLWGGYFSFLWSPMYGKVRVLGGDHGDFNMFIITGFGVTDTRVPCDYNKSLENGDKCPAKPADASPEETPLVYEHANDALKMTGVLGGGFRFYFREWFGLRAEVRDFIFPMRVYRPEDDLQHITDTIRNNLYFMIGASFLL